MTKEATLQAFFSGFGIPAYPSTAVPEDTTFPYLTYEVKTAAWGGDPVNMAVDIWYYTEDEALPNAKARELSKTIGLGGVLLRCDEGRIWLKRGSPWCQSLLDRTNKQVKRRFLNATAEYLTFF